MEARLPYLEELGVTYLHLMPLLATRPGEDDGGYAVSDYRRVRPELGDMDQLERLAGALRRRGISLCVDVVCNHTADTHEWALRALAGEEGYQRRFLMFPDRTLPDRYERTLPEVFPDFSPGNFTWLPQIQRWVWTTFNRFQWDLNYANPAVLEEMLGVILSLANRGVEVLRLDAVAFMWKRLGTDCQNQPEAHAILQVWRALTRVAAPGLLLKAEAIVSPELLVPYLGRGESTGRECELAYHNVLMVLIWSALAEKKVGLMTSALQRMPPIPPTASWMTYARCHDDIGWAITDADAGAVGLDAFAHRDFLSRFYAGEYPGSFARGARFQHNPRTGDARISGALASLAGLERALEEGDPLALELALRRVRLIHGVICAFGGTPLLYMGDELGLTSDYSYLREPALAGDNRWMHRPRMDWDAAALRHDPGTVPGRIFSELRALFAARAACPELHAAAPCRAVHSGSERVLGLLRDSPRGRLLALFNVSPERQWIPARRLEELGLGGPLRDRLSGLQRGPGDLALEACDMVWLTGDPP